MFIISEIFFFLSFFWTYFHRRLRPTIELGRYWPPSGIISFNPLGIPLLNRIILLTSRISVTWSHHRFILRNHYIASQRLLITIILGLYFSFLQIFEYFESIFRISDRVFGSRFFVITGFHGLHVIVGTLFLLVSYLRIVNGLFRHKHHFGFEASVWYWHFVDVVWIFLYIWIYCWRVL